MSFNRNCERYWDEASWVPVSVMVKEWCKNDAICGSAKEYAILNACEKGAISYRRSDGKTFEDPVEDLHGRGILLIDRASFMTWVAQFNDPKAPQEKISVREKENLHAIIGGLLTIILSEGNKNQTTVINQLVSTFKDIEPFSQRTLEKKFPEAKLSLSNKGISFDELLLSLKHNKLGKHYF